MADNFLERHREEYEIRKAAWLKKKKLFMKSGKKQKPQTQMPRPEDEALQARKCSNSYTRGCITKHLIVYDTPSCFLPHIP